MPCHGRLSVTGPTRPYSPYFSNSKANSNSKADLNSKANSNSSKIQHFAQALLASATSNPVGYLQARCKASDVWNGWKPTMDDKLAKMAKYKVWEEVDREGGNGYTPKKMARKSQDG